VNFKNSFQISYPQIQMTTPKPPSRAALAQALQVSVRRVGQLIKDESMPCDSIASAVAWKNAKDAPASPADERLKEERILLVKEQSRVARARADEAEGRTISREELAYHFQRTAAAVSAALRVLEAELPSLALGLPLEKSKPILKAKIREVQGKLADAQSEFWAEHPLTTTTKA
jgi:hypothetical protein